MTPPTVADHAWWLASRASGLVALLLITTSVVLGLSMAGRLPKKPGAKRSFNALHEHLAVAGIVAIAVHGVTLLGDAWLHPGWAGISVPFLMPYRQPWTGLGMIGGYLAAILGLSFYVRRRIGPRVWRKAHRMTIVVYMLAVAHTLGAGTDAGTPWMRWWFAFTAPLILILFVIRLVNSPSKARARRSPQPEFRRQPQIRPRPAAVTEEA
jgi:sulfoxide reductase heme-binding subunit YedZ